MDLIILCDFHLRWWRQQARTSRRPTTPWTRGSCVAVTLWAWWATQGAPRRASSPSYPGSWSSSPPAYTCCRTYTSASRSDTGLWIRIRDPVPFWPRDPGWEKNQDPDPESVPRDEHHGSYFRELRNTFLCLKYLNSFMRIRIRESFYPGSGMEKFGSGINIPATLARHSLQKHSVVDPRDDLFLIDFIDDPARNCLLKIRFPVYPLYKNYFL